MNVKLNRRFVWLILLFSMAACQAQPATKPTLTEAPQPLAAQTLAATRQPTATVSPSPTEIITSITPTLPSLPVASDPEFLEFTMFTPTDGWAISRDQNRVLLTRDGGQTWWDVTPPDLDLLPEGLASFGIQPFFLNTNFAWLMPNSTDGGSLYHTRDGGTIWQATSPPFEHASFTFLDPQVGYALVSLGAGAGSHYVALYRTLDSGIRWTMVFTHEPGASKSLPNAGSKNGITFQDAENGWIGGAIPMEDYFYLFYTEDGGVSWAQETDITLPGDFAGSMLDVYQPIIVDASTAYLPVRAYHTAGGRSLLIYRSEDAGETWAFRSAVEGGDSVDFVSAGEGWLAAGSLLYQSVDGGLTWSAGFMGGIPPGEVLLGVDFVDSQHGWVLTTPDSITWEPLKFYRTEDGGESWVLLLP